MKIRFLCLFALLGLTLGALAMPAGVWTSHFSYLNVTQVAETPGKVFAVADNHLFSVTKTGGEVETYTKVDGMSGNEVQYIAYGRRRGVLVVVYQDADIDLLSDNGDLYNIPDLADKQMAVVKTVNDISFNGDYAYLSCGFGVMVLNLAKHEIADTYYLGDEGTIAAVYGAEAQGGYLYALTANGVSRAALQGVNLNDYNNWESLYPLPSGQASRMRFMADTLYVADANRLYRMGAADWEVALAVDNDSLRLDGDESALYLSEGARGFLRMAKDGSREFLRQEAYGGLRLENGTYYIAGGTSGLVAVADETSRYYRPSGPYVSTCQYLTYAGDRVWMAPGGSWTDRLRYMAVLGACDTRFWTNYTYETMGTGAFVEWTQDIVSVAVDPKDADHVFFATWGEGVFETRGGKVTAHHTDGNSSIEKVADSPHYVRCDGLRFDTDGNLWVLNSGSSVLGSGLSEVRSVKVLTAAGEWLSLECLRNENLLRHLVITRKGQKWFVAVRYTPGIYVLDDGGTLEDTSDDQLRKFTTLTDQDGNALTITYAYDIAEDRDGALWAATDIGLLTFYSPSRAFDDDYTCTRVKVARDDGSGLADYLFDGVSVRCVAVDAANRKWVGTDNSGVYLLSADGTETLAHFTKDNSPLSSDQINAIAVHGRTGEVFFAVTGGIMSYGGDAVEPVRKYDRDLVQVWPNPVRPDYAGQILITGLEEESLVRVVNAAGQLVFEGKSNGGSIAWDGKNAAGRPVSGGMYFVLCVNSDEEDNRGVAAKIMVIR